MHEIYVRQSIEAGLADSEAGRVVDVTENLLVKYHKEGIDVFDDLRFE